jgi:hypothetical protein
MVDALKNLSSAMPNMMRKRNVCRSLRLFKVGKTKANDYINIFIADSY